MQQPSCWNMTDSASGKHRSGSKIPPPVKDSGIQKIFACAIRNPIPRNVLFNLAFSRSYAVFSDLSSLGNFYSFSIDIIINNNYCFALFGWFMHFLHVYFMHLLLFLFYFIFILNIFIFKH